MRNKAQWLLMAVMAALLAMTFWYSLTIWRTTPAMSLYGSIIMGVAAALAVVAGCGLIALMYHSRRKRFDEPPHVRAKQEEGAD